MAKNIDNPQKKEKNNLDKKVKENMSKIKHKILVLSNKGGVGKSSVAINLACALSGKGFKVGILDADLHGPSVAKMLGFEGKKLQGSSEGIIPITISSNLIAVSMASDPPETKKTLFNPWGAVLHNSLAYSFISLVENWEP